MPCDWKILLRNWDWNTRRHSMIRKYPCDNVCVCGNRGGKLSMIGYKKSEKNFLIGRIRCNFDAPNANATKSVAEL